MHLQYHPYLLPLVFSAIVCIALAIFAWKRRSAPGAIPFAALMLGVAQWSLANALQMASTDLSAKLFWANSQYLGSSLVPATWLVFALEYTGHQKRLTRRNLTLLAIEPLLVMAIAWSNPLHGLFRSSVELGAGGPFAVLNVTFGPVLWLHVAYSYLLFLMGIFLIAQAFVRSPRPYRGQMGMVLIGALAPWIANVIDILGLNPFQRLDLTPFAFTLTGLIMAWGIFRFQLLDIVPIARNAVIEGMTDGVIVLDVQNRVVDLNPAARTILGAEGADALGQPLSRVLPAELRSNVDLGYLTERNIEVVLAKRGTEETFYDLRISPLYDRQGKFTGRLIILRDATRRKRAEETLARACDEALEMSRLKSEILANVSHDLRTPLNAIWGYADMLQNAVYGPLSEAQDRAAGRIVANTRRLMTLINDLLAQAEIEAGGLTLRTVPVSVAELIRDTESMLSDQAGYHSLQLDCEIADDVPATISGDPQRLRQILANLVSNAIKFTDQGSVQVRVYLPDEAHWSLQVSDTGRGIPAEAQKYIFEPFRQVDGSPTREHGGVGLGLSLVQHMVGLMKGHIELESKVGQGSTFTVFLPLSQSQEESSCKNHLP